jgi:protein TonB
LSGSAAAHVGVLLLVLAFVRGPPLPPEPEPQIVELVFEAPSAASTAVNPLGVVPADSGQQPAVTASEPAPQPPEQTLQPPQAQPTQAQPTQAQPPPAQRPQASSLPRPLPEPLPAPPLPAVAAPREASKPAPARQAALRPRPAPATAVHAPASPTTAPATAANRQAAPFAGSPAQAAPSGSTPAREASAATVDGAWRQALGAWLAAHKTYPEQARRRGEEGTVAIRFTVNRAGRVLDVDVVRGSGSAVLDAAASTLLRGAALPPFVASMTQEQATVTVPLRYSLVP